MRLPEHLLNQPLARRQNPAPTATSKSLGTGAIVGIVLASICVISIIGYLASRRLRGSHPEGRRIPTSFLKRTWQSWQPKSKADNSTSSLSRMIPWNRTASRSFPSSSRSQGASRAGPIINNLTIDEIVDRHTSVRSIITLPAYQLDARPTEKILGREGDRAGVDVVVHFPETVEEEETRRDEEMESLYQIRVARREERSAREERRRLRTEARERGDIDTLAQLRQQRRQEREAQQAENSAALIQEHNARDRRGRVSSVSYADLGVARHDGTRIRADSNGSDNLPLLENASTIDTDASRPRTARPSTGTGARSFLSHLRNQSSTSLGRVLTMDISDDEGGRSSAEATPWESRSTNASRTTLARPDTADTFDHPPEYDGLSSTDARRRPLMIHPPLPGHDLGEAPPYESPIAARRSQRLSGLPSIEVTPFTPILGDGESNMEGNLQSSSSSEASEDCEPQSPEQWHDAAPTQASSSPPSS